jgi:triosephosphate isomerase
MHFKHYLTSGEAVEYLEQQLQQEVHYYDLDNLIRAEAIEPPEKIGGRRLWSHDNLKEAAKALRIRRAKRPVLTEERSLIDEDKE